MVKRYLRRPDLVRPLAEGLGVCIVTDRISVDGAIVAFMYRDEPVYQGDSGWRFQAGDEDQSYVNDPSHHGAFDVNTLANMDPAVIPYLALPVGSELVREGDGFVLLSTLSDADSEAATTEPRNRRS